ncbi:hypothetical protein DFQ28_002703 [Apophysomyces sp. BC1034]|nr:hypothetical protein DFQ30_000942 [Apophysomyces sp. BC1015]KAG0180589.1 hypothetical protein DFQ29_000390 [Apophysomyces sp. BC1021]KAG0189948.1 hypothetical protein DFQ28_002703 [Apophysomyces sp. BC1034]
MTNPTDAADGIAHKPTISLSPAVSAFQFKPQTTVRSDGDFGRSVSPQQARSTIIKDGYVYKDEVVILDQEKKEELLKVGTIALQTEWTFWYDKYVPNLPATEYEANLQVISTVGSVQKFWSVYNNIDGPEKLGFRSNLHFMRKDIKPIWEDPRNEYGGSYNFKIPKQQSPMAWRDLLVLLIGEKVENWIGDMVCGVSVSSRQNCDNYQIWMANGDHTAQDTQVRNQLADLLKPAEIQSFYFKIHKNHAAFQKPKEKSSWQEDANALLKGAPLLRPVEMRRKITEESIERVVADIERLSMKHKEKQRMMMNNNIT